jgi:hypothetical protein
MKKSYKSALGRQIDIDSLRLSNENIIAVGNMKVNARGDELGPGGEVIRTRNEVMSEYYNRNAGVVTKTAVPVSNETEAIQQAQQAQERASARPRGSAARRILEDQDGIE